MINKTELIIQSESSDNNINHSEISKDQLNQFETTLINSRQSHNHINTSKTYKNVTKIHHSNEEILIDENLTENSAKTNNIDVFEYSVRCLIKEYNEFHLVFR